MIKFNGKDGAFKTENQIKLKTHHRIQSFLTNKYMRGYLLKEMNIQHISSNNIQRIFNT